MLEFTTFSRPQFSMLKLSFRFAAGSENAPGNSLGQEGKSACSPMKQADQKRLVLKVDSLFVSTRFFKRMGSPEDHVIFKLSSDEHHSYRQTI